MVFNRNSLNAWLLLGLGIMLGFGGVLAGRWLITRLIGVRVSNVFPQSLEPVAATTHVGVEFSVPMQPQSVESRFRLLPVTEGEFAWEGQRLWYRPMLPLQPGTTYEARIDPGAVSQEGDTLQQAATWRFTVRTPQLIYLSLIEGESALWRVPANQEGGSPVRITGVGGKITDYAISRDGNQIAFVRSNLQGGSDIWLTDERGTTEEILVDCGPDRCSAPAWSADRTWLAFVREQAALDSDSLPVPPQVWLIDVREGVTQALYQDQHVWGEDPVWAPLGSQLAFYDAQVAGIRLLDLESGQEEVLPTQMGLTGAWSPDSRLMAFNRLLVVDEKVSIEVLVADLTSKHVDVILDEGTGWSDFGVPAWSPTGEWLALTLRAAPGAPVKQLWVMRPDGTQAHVVGSEPGFTYGGYRWDPWGRAIAYQRLELENPDAEPEVLVWQMDSGRTSYVVRGAGMPAWLP